jgi:hypothetical protein
MKTIQWISISMETRKCIISADHQNLSFWDYGRYKICNPVWGGRKVTRGRVCEEYPFLQ